MSLSSLPVDAFFAAVEINKPGAWSVAPGQGALRPGRGPLPLLSTLHALLFTLFLFYLVFLVLPGLLEDSLQLRHLLSVLLEDDSGH